MKSKLIMEIPPKLKEYLDNNRSVYAGNNRGSLPSITDPGEPLQLDSLNLIRLVAFFESDFGYRIEDEELRAENSQPCGHWESYLRLKHRLGRQAKPTYLGGDVPSILAGNCTNLRAVESDFEAFKAVPTFNQPMKNTPNLQSNHQPKETL